MLPNIDPDTGIAYGIHNASSLDSEILYDFDTFIYSGCPYCGHELDMTAEKCRCGAYIEYMELEIIAAIYEKEGYSIYHGYESNWVWVFKSPYITDCLECSPCAPHAGDLDSPCESGTGVETYCLDSSFFENEKAPYMYKKRD